MGWRPLSSCGFRGALTSSNIFYSNDDQGRVYQTCKFHDPGDWVYARVWPYKSLFNSEYALSSTLSIYSTLIAIVLRDFDAVFLCRC